MPSNKVLKKAPKSVSTKTPLLKHHHRRQGFGAVVPFFFLCPRSSFGTVAPFFIPSFRFFQAGSKAYLKHVRACMRSWANFPKNLFGLILGDNLQRLK